MLIKTIIFFITASLLIYSQDITDTSSVVNDSSIVVDSIAVEDSTIMDSVILLDTVIVYPKHLSENSVLIEREVFLRNDYRYAGNFIEPFQFNFIRDLGIIGQPNESFVYGVGVNGISYLIDGFLYNDRRFNSLDLNLLQSEDIEIIEIVPLPRGFLYGPWNNPVTVNIITRDFIPSEPYSRIKYYQGPDGEAMVDGSFNSRFSKNLQVSFDVTNRKFDSSYTNTAFSTWQAKVKAKYNFSSNFYLAASLNHAAQKTGLWGGVNSDSILSLGLAIDDLLYTPDEAPVNNANLKQKDLLNFSTIRLTNVQNENSRTEVSLYHSFKETKIENPGYVEYDNTTWGININQSFRRSIFYFYLAGNYEKNTLEEWYRYSTETETISNYEKYFTNFLSVSGSVSSDITDKFKPSVFFKISNAHRGYDDFGSDVISSGIGVDLKYLFFDNVNLYAGYSLFDKTFYENDKTNILELGAKYSSENILADLKYFRRDNTNIFKGPAVPTINPIFYNIGDVSGLGLSVKASYLFWQLETQAAVYFANEGDLYKLPDFSFVSGLYYRGDLFEDNLNLKAGLKFTYLGNINSISDYYGLTSVEPSNKLDFILSGEIRKAAIIYFTWENLTDNRYYITPYYPMPGRSIRFGLAWELWN